MTGRHLVHKKSSFKISTVTGAFKCHLLLAHLDSEQRFQVPPAASSFRQGTALSRPTCCYFIYTVNCAFKYHLPFISHLLKGVFNCQLPIPTLSASPSPA